MDWSPIPYLVGVFALLLWAAVFLMRRGLAFLKKWLTRAASRPLAPPSPIVQVNFSVASGQQTASNLSTSLSGSRDITRRAFERVMQGVTASASDKEWVLERLLVIGEADSRSIEKVFLDLIAVIKDWPEFDHWALEFKKRGEWPYMWASLGLDKETPVEPASVADPIDRMTVAEMKSWLRTYAPGLKPIAGKREDVELRCLMHLAWEQIREAALAHYQDSLRHFRRSREKAKARLLAHTYHMTWYSIRDELDKKELGLTRWKASVGENCSVE